MEETLDKSPKMNKESKRGKNNKQSKKEITSKTNIKSCEKNSITEILKSVQTQNTSTKSTNNGIYRSTSIDHTFVGQTLKYRRGCRYLDG